MIRRFMAHARMCAAQAFDGGVFYIATGYVLRLLQPIMLMLIWRQLLSGGQEAFSLNQMLTYTLWSAVLSQQLDVHTSASEDFWEGEYGMRYLRPAPVLWQVTAETFGRWIPGFLLFSIPALVLAAIVGLPIAPFSAARGLAGLLSLGLSMSLGFCVDYLFITFSVVFRNAGYQATLIRGALTLVFSGAVIPFAALPWGLDRVFAMLPLGALAGAPLSIYTGLAEGGSTLLYQVFWNVVLWPLAILALRKCAERMVSFGG